MEAAAPSSSEGTRAEDEVTPNEDRAVPQQTSTKEDANARGKSKVDTEDSGAEAAKKPSIMSRMWKKTQLDVPTILIMMKGGLPPVISLAIYQSSGVAATYATLGYLVAIVSILGLCIMPRAKFIQTMSINVLAVCLGAAVAMLQCWCGVKARQHTEPAGLPPARYRYNSSQSAVCGIWLFFQIWLINTMKAKFPQFSLPSVLFSIFANIASTTGATYQNMTQVETFVQRLLEAFLTGFAIATAVSLFVMPVSMRTVVSKEVTGYIGLLRGALKAHKGYFKSLETKDMFRQVTYIEPKDGSEERKEQIRPEIKAVKDATAAFTQLHGKLNADLPFAKREFAYGKLSPDDYQSIFKNLRAIMMPLVGVTSIIDIFERLAELNGWEKETQEDIKQEVMDDWHHLMTYAHNPIQNMLDTMDTGLEHIAIRLQLSKPPNKKPASTPDPEAKGEQVLAGDAAFAAHFEAQATAFFARREEILAYWLKWKGITVGDNFFEPETVPNVKTRDVEAKHRQQRQLFLVLHILFLLHSISAAILDFIKWSDLHDQSTARKRLITPGKKRLRKWLGSLFSTQDSPADDETTAAGMHRTNAVVHMGDAYRKRLDPDHLPPANAWERFGESLRKITSFLRSSESAFGFRVACATMSISIVAYLATTQLWFTRQRVVWATLMIALSMTPTSGLAMFNFFWRVFGTILAMLAAWLMWYIPDQKTPGILVILYVFVALAHWILLKRPDLMIPGLISIVTCVMVIGYELQVRKLGEQLATSNGQPYYNITELGPYRLACVATGIAVAFIWTYFPYPITEHSALRTKLGGALYLSANMYSIMHETVMARIRGDGGDPEDKANPSHQLLKARNKVFAKQMLALQALRQHSAMVSYEFPLGGKFPKKDYDAIIAHVSNITNYAALLGLASRSFGMFP